MKLEEELLISAYLDGEVSADERQRAEKLLAGSAEARQLADEMRGVRVRLQGLPRFGLPADFAEQTVRRAEQELAAAKTVDVAVASAAPVGSSESRAAHSDEPSIWRTWRGFAWAAVALAAGLLLMVTSRPNADYSTQLAANQRDAVSTSSDVRSKSEQPGVEPAPTSPPMKQVVSESPAGSDLRIQAASDEPPRSERSITGFSTKSDHPSIHSGLPEGATGGKGSSAITYGTAAPEPTSRADSVTANEAVEMDADEYIVITVNITPEAARRQEFKQLLAKHNIKIDEEMEEKGGEQFTARGRETLGLDPNLHQWMPNVVGKADAFYFVEASPAQLTATIKELALAKKKGLWSVNKAKWIPVQGSAEDETVNEAPVTDRTEPKVESAVPQPPGPASTTDGQPLPAMDENETKSDLLSPRPTERGPATSEPKTSLPKEPSDDKKPAASDPADRRDRENAESTDRAVGAVAPDGKQKAAGADKTTESSGEKKPAPRRALFVLRVSPDPVPAVAPAPAAPADK